MKGVAPLMFSVKLKQDLEFERRTYLTDLQVLVTFRVDYKNSRNLSFINDKFILDPAWEK